MKNNIFLESLEIGYKNQFNGISFNEMTKELNIDDKLNDISFKLNFAIWFFDNFYFTDTFSQSINTKKNPTGDYSINKYKIDEFLSKYSDNKHFIKGESIQKYLDFIELKEARKSSKEANTQSKKAIRLAIWSLISSVIFGVLSLILTYVISKETVNVIVTENRDKNQECFNQIISRLDTFATNINVNEIINNEAKKTTEVDSVNNNEY